MPKWHLWRWLGVAAAGAGLAVLWAWPRQIEVEVAAVEQGRVQVTVDVEARTRVRERWTVVAPVIATLERLPWRAGDAVRADEVVARLRPMQPMPLDARTTGELQAHLAAAAAALQEADAATSGARHAERHARRERQRQERLWAGGASTAVAKDAAHAEWTLRRAALDAAEAHRQLLAHQRTAIANQLQPPTMVQPPLEVRAPMSGRVLRVWQQGPGPVMTGAPLLELGDPSELEVVADLLTPDAVQLAAGASVEFSHWGSDVLLRGQMQRIEPGGFSKVSALGVEEQRVWAVFEPVGDAPLWRQLGDGFRLDAKVLVWQGQVVRVPTSALARQDQNWFVFVAVDGRARWRQVHLGHRGEQFAEVRQGLKPGEHVIVFPGTEVHDGVRIRSPHRP